MPKSYQKPQTAIDHQGRKYPAPSPEREAAAKDPL
jgi:hypothetical protein